MITPGGVFTVAPLAVKESSDEATVAVQCGWGEASAIVVIG